MQTPSQTISIRDAYRGKRVLVTGTSGFLGKVWLAMVLDQLPEIGKLYVLLRKKGLRPVSHRFEKMVGESPVFKPLHEKYGADLARLISERVEVVDGDIARPDFGMTPEIAERLTHDLDLVVNSAGLVDFDPDVREAIATNIDGGMNAIEFIGKCDHARLVHISTCYVVGNRSGRIAETVDVGYSPRGGRIDPAVELAAMRAKVAECEALHSGPEFDAQLAEAVVARIAERGLDPKSATVVRNVTKQEKDRTVRKAMEKIGSARAEQLGWPNTYTWSKSLAEQLMTLRAKELGATFSILRPAIVESAVAFPFPGWNEGFNTSGPLVYLLGTWFRGLPQKPNNPFDVIPVDFVCKAITVAGAETLLGVNSTVYHAGSSHRNTFTVQRATEITSLAHREFYRKNGKTVMERAVLSRADAVPVKPDHMLSIGNVRKTARGVASFLSRVIDVAPKPVKKQVEQLHKVADGADKELKSVERMTDLFLPFIHDNNWIFVSDALYRHPAIEAEFVFDVRTINWLSYWKDTQVPGLRRWCFPQFEGGEIETYTPAVPFKMLPAPVAKSETVAAATPKAVEAAPAPVRHLKSAAG